MNELDAVGLVLEVLGLVCTSLAAIALFAALIVKLVDSTWSQTQAVIATDAPVPTAHWIAADNVVYSRELDDDERKRYGTLEEVVAFYSRRAPSHLRFERTSGLQRALWVLFLLTAAVGVGAMLTSVGLGFFEV